MDIDLHGLDREPDDLQRWMVLSDWLQAQGDPRGPWVALHLADETGSRKLARDEARRYLWDHRTALLGPLADRFDTVVTWRRGYIDRLECIVEGFTKKTAGHLHALQTDRGLWALRDLRLVSTANFDAVIEAFCHYDWPVLERLRMGPTNVGAGVLNRPVQAILDAAPRLRTLRVEWPSTLSGLVHPHLESLTVSAPPETIAGLELTGLPSLKRLALHSRDPVGPDALTGIRGRELERLELYDKLNAGWRESVPTPPKTLALHSKDAQTSRFAQQLGCRVVGASGPSPYTDALLTPAWQRSPRRFERAGRFWQIHRDKTDIVLRYGRLGNKGTERRTGMRTPYDAAKDYRHRVAKKRKEGFIEVFVPS